VVLLSHGGAGSWRHWVRNILGMMRTHTLVAPDLPGLGDSARCPEPIGAEAIAGVILDGLDKGVAPDAPLHIAGFSFGGVIAGLVAAKAGARVGSLTLIGTGGLGLPNRTVELERVRDKTGDERLAAHRTNLLRMMLHAPESVDALALEIQEQNTRRARLNSGFMWISTVLADALPRVRGHVHGLWGEHDLADRDMLNTRVGLLRNARPDAEIAVVPDAGHWLSYEAAAWFNQHLAGVVAR